MDGVPVTDENEPLLLKFMLVIASVTLPSPDFIVGFTSHVFAAVLLNVRVTKCEVPKVSNTGMVVMYMSPLPAVVVAKPGLVVAPVLPEESEIVSAMSD